MLAQFTWQDFLIAALILSLLWYVGIMLIYFRGKIPKFGNQQKRSAPTPGERKPEEEPEDGELIGRTREPDGVSSVGMEELRFAPRSEPDDDPDDYRDTQLGDVPDVLEELKRIFSILENEGGTKEDFISLFALVVAKHPKIKGTPSQQAINEYIRNHLLFPISDEELEALWE
ncbi:hypothetical protein CHU00_06660 [Sphingobacterium cellulitidis]|uniref:hypothetical protein n=1 Tax=Sphingobacterium cellulitidis TaxID=1768011 RepID=UPI000B93C6DB|nr:hypothetical protein [Sphingobacterium cellulitidis]OYD46366.1 hypothetical protein CHU00_06660 [Sphingobacterium cellulitidis]